MRLNFFITLFSADTDSEMCGRSDGLENAARYTLTSQAALDAKDSQSMSPLRRSKLFLSRTARRTAQRFLVDQQT